MDVKGAVTRAKEYVADIFQGEGLSNLGLEEIEFNEARHLWEVTVGFSRPWDRSGIQAALGVFGDQNTKRFYKVVRIDDATGSVIAVKNREPAA